MVCESPGEMFTFPLVCTVSVGVADMCDRSESKICSTCGPYQSFRSQDLLHVLFLSF